MGIAPLIALLIAFILIENGSSQVENITSSEISPSFRMILPSKVLARTTLRTNLKPLTTKAKPKIQVKSANIIQWTTKASSRITTTAKRNGQTTKPIKNQQLQKTTPKRTQTTKAKAKSITTTQKLAQMKKTTKIAVQSRKPSAALFFNSPFLTGAENDGSELWKFLPEPVLIKLNLPSTNVSSFDPTSSTTEDYEDYGNFTTTELPELYDDLTPSNATLTASLPTAAPEAFTVEDVTRKRLKRRKTTTIDPAMTTRRRLKRRKTTTVGSEQF